MQTTHLIDWSTLVWFPVVQLMLFFDLSIQIKLCLKGHKSWLDKGFRNKKISCAVYALYSAQFAGACFTSVIRSCGEPASISAHCHQSCFTSRQLCSLCQQRHLSVRRGWTGVSNQHHHSRRKVWLLLWQQLIWKGSSYPGQAVHFHCAKRPEKCRHTEWHISLANTGPWWCGWRETAEVRLQSGLCWRCFTTCKVTTWVYFS